MKINHQTKVSDNKAKLIKRLAISNFSIDELLLEQNQLLHLPIHKNDGLNLIEYYTKDKDTLQSIYQHFNVKKTDVEYFNRIDLLYVIRGQSLQLMQEEKRETSNDPDLLMTI